MRWMWAASISVQVRRQVQVSSKYSEFLPRVRLISQFNIIAILLGIIEYKKNKKEEEPKRKMNTRGALNIGGMTDFNPDANVRLSR